MERIYYPANERGYCDNGWLKANYSFNFGAYNHPDRIRFGAIKAFNDDLIKGGKGFETHPHDNVEIIMIPISGGVEHKDSLGSIAVIQPDAVQIMSAGSGVSHSEYNYLQTEETNTLQICIFPKVRNTAPRYEQRCFKDALKPNQFTTLLSPDNQINTLKINQDAYFLMGDFNPGQSINYTIKIPGNGAYIFVIEGAFTIGEYLLNKRDALGVYNTDSFTIKTEAQSRLLLIEVPML